MSSEVVAWAAIVIGSMALVVAMIAVGQHKRIVRLENHLELLPSAREISAMREKIAHIDARQESVYTETQAARAAIRRVEDFLLKSARTHV